MISTIATFYRGSVLLIADNYENEKDIKSGVFPFTGQENRDSAGQGYSVVMDVRAVYHLDASSGDYRLKLTCGANSVFSKSKVVELLYQGF